MDFSYANREGIAAKEGRPVLRWNSRYFAEWMAALTAAFITPQLEKK